MIAVYFGFVTVKIETYKSVLVYSQHLYTKKHLEKPRKIIHQSKSEWSRMQEASMLEWKGRT